jgi:hypothetical protein
MLGSSGAPTLGNDDLVGVRYDGAGFVGVNDELLTLLLAVDKERDEPDDAGTPPIFEYVSVLCRAARLR